MKKIKTYNMPGFNDDENNLNNLNNLNYSEDMSLVVQESQEYKNGLVPVNNNDVIVPDGQVQVTNQGNLTTIDYYSNSEVTPQAFPFDQFSQNNGARQPQNVTINYYQQAPNPQNNSNQMMMNPVNKENLEEDNSEKKNKKDRKNKNEALEIASQKNSNEKKFNEGGFNKTKNAEAEKNYIIKQALIRNPFLFDDFPENNYITSIEDFYVEYKNEQYRFGEVIRSKELARRKKKKILKICFKKWKDEIDTRLEEDALIGEGQFENGERQSNQAIKVGAAPFVLAPIMMIIAMLLISGKVNFLGTLSKFEFLIMSCVIPILIGIVCIGALLNKTNNIFSKLNKFSKDQYDKKLKSLKNDFNKKYNTTYGYYKNGYKGKFKKNPLPIKKTAVGSEKFNTLEEIVKGNCQINQNQGKKKGGQKAIKGLVGFLTVITTMFVVGDGLYHVVMGVINLIRNR